jgi:radical SAM superfamily enzyme YgiQ (UPF0313 family)
MSRVLLINPPSPERLGTPRFHADEDPIVREAVAFAPDVIGVALFTRYVLTAYRLVERLAGLDALLVAGGPHATVLPEEALDRGFDVVVAGEAEIAFPRLLDAVDRGDPGCPARCTFCANYVTGRKLRHHSPENVVERLTGWHRRTGATFFPFWDDAFTADRRRLAPLCRAFGEDLPFDLGFSAITRADLVTRESLRTMRRAGLVTAGYGVESGDDAVLEAIGKGVRTDRVVRALEWSKAEGVGTTASFMLGFPQETPAALTRTLRFMERIAPLVDSFGTEGVVVPFPGTPLYEEFADECGFREWWLEDWCLAPDGILERDFFRYPPESRDLIREGLRYQREHNAKRIGCAG